MFLEAEAPLGSNLQWQQLQPMHGSILEGVARLPKQLFGAPQMSFSACWFLQKTKRYSENKGLGKCMTSHQGDRVHAERSSSPRLV